VEKMIDSRVLRLALLVSSATLPVSGLAEPPRPEAGERTLHGDPSASETGLRWQARLDPDHPVTIQRFVTDIVEATAWYRAVFDGAPTKQPLPTVTAFEITKGCWLELVESEHVRPGDLGVGPGLLRPLAIGVNDLRVEKSRLESLGVAGELVQPDPRVTVFDFRDPYGNALSFYELHLE
jgi:hypothetical protein